MKNFALIWIAILSLGLPVFAQTGNKRPTTLPPKSVKSETQFEEPPSVTTSTINSSAPDTESSHQLNPGKTANLTKDGYFFRRPEGYPQQQIAVIYEPTRFSTKWTLDDVAFKFDPVATEAFGVAYHYLFSNAAEAEILYRHYSLKVDSDSASGLNLNESTSAFDSLFARFEYSWIGAERYFNSYGFGLEVGQDSYPTLEFTDASTLELKQARDLVIGLSVQSQLYLLQPFSYKFKVGYDHGFDMRHMGGPDTKKNQSYYATVGVEYMINQESSLIGDAEYRVRDSTNTGKRGVQEAEWDTDTAESQLRIGYLATFR